MKKNEEYLEKRKKLMQMSAEAKEAREGKINNARTNSEAIYWASRPLNFFIVELFYKGKVGNEFKTFPEWKKEGKRVKKGAKGLPVWGRPVGDQKAEKTGETSPETDDLKYFPLSYIFSDLQVEKETEQN